MKVDEFVAEVNQMCAKRTAAGFSCAYERAIIKDRIPRLIAIIERQRAALKSIAEDDMGMCDSCDSYQETAREALEEGV